MHTVDIHHYKKQMEWIWDTIKDEAGKLLALLVATIGAMLLAGLKRLPKFIGFKRTILDELTIINRADGLKTIFRTLKRHSGALYIHVIRYHNGHEADDKSEIIDYDRMSIEYEIIGKTCGLCGADCFKLTGGIPEVKPDWQGIPIADDWRAECYNKTMKSKGEVNTVSIDQMSAAGQEIFEIHRLKIYKEIFICKTKRGIYTLGLSFCNKFEKPSLADGMMTLAAKQLSNNLLI